jgi:hypothetical protein
MIGYCISYCRWAAVGTYLARFVAGPLPLWLLTPLGLCCPGPRGGAMAVNESRGSGIRTGSAPRLGGRVEGNDAAGGRVNVNCQGRSLIRG